MRAKISRVKVLSFVLILEISASFAYYFHGFYKNNSNAVTVVTATFSILAGFLVAILSVVWDERVIRAKTWRASVVELQLIKKDIFKHQIMFYLYLVVLVLALMSSLDFKVQAIEGTIDFLVLFFASIALIFSFRLPGYLMRRNMSELNRIIRERKEKETSGESSAPHASPRDHS